MCKISIVREPLGWVVREGAMPRARLHWQAPGLDIYVLGAMPVATYAIVCNIACNEAIARNIPALSLRRVAK